jgi:hypothetical protein
MKHIVMLLCCVFFFCFPTTVLAHLPGQQSFFKINESYTTLYPVPSSSLPDFILPQDSAPKSFLIGESIAFAIDTTRLPMMSDATLAKSRFQWDFGDGKTFEGLETTHEYEKMGSYILQIWVDDGSGGAPILLQSILLNVIPDAFYKLPKAIISVNGKTSIDSLTDPLTFSFARPLIFDVSKSIIPSGIASIQWDLGDMHASSQKSLQYQYKNDLRIVFPVLRIKDKNGFIADTFIQLNNGEYDNEEQSQANPSKSFQKVITQYALMLIGVIGMVLVGIILVLFVKKSKQKA